MAKSIKNIVVLCLVVAFVFVPLFFVGCNESEAKNTNTESEENQTKNTTLVFVADETNFDGNNFQEALTTTVEKLENFVNTPGVNISIEQPNKILFEITDKTIDYQEILDSIKNPVKLEFKIEEGADSDAILTGKNIQNVYATYNNQDNEWGVAVVFDAEGKKIFADTTSAHVNDKLYLYVNNELISAPTIKEAITNGTTFISGNYTQKTAEQFADQIYLGTLPVTLAYVETLNLDSTANTN